MAQYFPNRTHKRNNQISNAGYAAFLLGKFLPVRVPTLKGIASKGVEELRELIKRKPIPTPGQM